MTQIDLTLRRIRAFAAAKGWTKSRLALEAGLCDTVLRHFDQERWNPTVQTLRTLEAVIPEDFDPGPDACVAPSRTDFARFR